MNHIALTVADLKTERQKLDVMIEALEIYETARFKAETTPTPLPVPERKKRKPRKVAVVHSTRAERQAVEAIGTNSGQTDGLLNTKAIENGIVEKSKQILSSIEGDKATTVSGAMKQIMLASIDTPLTSRQIETAVKAQYPDLAAKAKLENIAANLYYWESQMNVVKVGTGALAVWKINKIDYFKVLVED